MDINSRKCAVVLKYVNANWVLGKCCNNYIRIGIMNFMSARIVAMTTLNLAAGSRAQI